MRSLEPSPARRMTLREKAKAVGIQPWRLGLPEPRDLADRVWREKRVRED